MLKPHFLLSVLLLLPAQAIAAPTASESVAPPEFSLGTAGICWRYHLSGYLALDTEGELLPLRPYCQQQRNWAWHEPSRFWQQFREVATAETLNYSQKLDQDAIEAYGQSICLFLAEGGTPQQLGQIQATPDFPAEFEQAVTLAAVNSYCKQYRQLYSE